MKENLPLEKHSSSSWRLWRSCTDPQLRLEHLNITTITHALYNSDLYGRLARKKLPWDVPFKVHRKPCGELKAFAHQMKPNLNFKTLCARYTIIIASHLKHSICMVKHRCGRIMLWEYFSFSSTREACQNWEEDGWSPNAGEKNLLGTAEDLTQEQTFTGQHKQEAKAGVPKCSRELPSCNL